jgi:hypothetical protein
VRLDILKILNIAVGLSHLLNAKHLALLENWFLLGNSSENVTALRSSKKFYFIFTSKYIYFTKVNGK